MTEDAWAAILGALRLPAGSSVAAVVAEIHRMQSEHDENLRALARCLGVPLGAPSAGRRRPGARRMDGEITLTLYP